MNFELNESGTSYFFECQLLRSLVLLWDVFYCLHPWEFKDIKVSDKYYLGAEMSEGPNCAVIGIDMKFISNMFHGIS